ncbi:TetR/AcrR family transcriptional regulator [Streptomyces sp. NPDC088253]|uniref:TetR/AcrR family transcriptional regulator n=1 Tax=Streptomyces sp. NPDC088253 TaxID=3365846 RepID=UPI0037F5E0EB
MQEIADAAEVSKMTVFNYFGSKEDLVFRPVEDHFGDAARAVRERRPEESPWEAVRRQLLEMVEARDPAVGLNDDPIARQVRELVMRTPVLMERAFLAAQKKGTRDLAALLAEETGDTMAATVAAAMLSAARNAVIEEHHRRIDAGESADTVAADAPGRAERAFALVEHGLGDYARKA